MQEPILEEMLIYLGQFLSIAVSIFIAVRVDKRLGQLFIAAWLLDTQFLFITNFDLIPESTEAEALAGQGYKIITNVCLLLRESQYMPFR